MCVFFCVFCHCLYHWPDEEAIKYVFVFLRICHCLWHCFDREAIWGTLKEKSLNVWRNIWSYLRHILIVGRDYLFVLFVFTVRLAIAPFDCGHYLSSNSKGNQAQPSKYYKSITSFPVRCTFHCCTEIDEPGIWKGQKEKNMKRSYLTGIW